MRSSRIRVSCLSVVLVFGLHGPAQAQNSLQSRMSLSYQGTPVEPVLKALAEVLGYRLQLDSKVTGTVTVSVWWYDQYTSRSRSACTVSLIPAGSRVNTRPAGSIPAGGATASQSGTPRDSHGAALQMSVDSVRCATMGVTLPGATAATTGAMGGCSLGQR